MNIDKYMFLAATGNPPVQDDLERCNCDKAGQFGHKCCGWCSEKNQPVFSCGCEACIERGKS